MKTPYFGILAMAAIIGLVSCSDRSEACCEGGVVRISGTIDISDEEPGQAVTRTGMSGSTASFTSGDNIGVSETITGRSNVKFSYASGTWTTFTPLYWYNGTSDHTFYAYYPYNASTQSGLVSIPLLSGQSFSSSPDATCDMLVSGATTQKRSTGTNVALSFKHAFTLLQFNVTSPALSTYKLKTMTVTGGNTAGGSSGYGIVNIVNTVPQIGYNLSAGAVQTNANNNTTYAQSITKAIPSTGFLGSIAVTYYAIILPGTYSNPVPKIKFNISSLTTDNQDTQSVELPNTQFNTGTKYIYSVQVGNTIGTKAQESGKHEEIPVKCTLSEHSYF